MVYAFKAEKQTRMSKDRSERATSPTDVAPSNFPTKSYRRCMFAELLFLRQSGYTVMNVSHPNEVSCRHSRTARYVSMKDQEGQCVESREEYERPGEKNGDR